MMNHRFLCLIKKTFVKREKKHGNVNHNRFDIEILVFDFSHTNLMTYSFCIFVLIVNRGVSRSAEPPPPPPPLMFTEKIQPPPSTTEKILRFSSRRRHYCLKQLIKFPAAAADI
jgi:hypothetical protein